MKKEQEVKIITHAKKFKTVMSAQIYIHDKIEGDTEKDIECGFKVDLDFYKRMHKIKEYHVLNIDNKDFYVVLYGKRPVYA